MVIDSIAATPYKRRMAFDDLARHMASRDKRKLGEVSTPEQLVSEMAIADRRMTRTSDLILGAILLAGGVVLAVAFSVIYVDLFRLILHPERLTERISAREMTMMLAGAAVGVMMVVMGLFRLYRGFRGRSR